MAPVTLDMKDLHTRSAPELHLLSLASESIKSCYRNYRNEPEKSHKSI
jgi:hypothetical protein